MACARRVLVLAASALVLPLASCGFALRQAPDFGFHSIYLALPAGSALGVELRRQLEGTGSIQVITDAARRADADVVLESAGEQRERAVVSLTATGEVRELQLRLRFAFRVRTPAGRELLAQSEILRQVDQSYSESAALSKEQEALMLYQDMQSDIVQQVMRRLATIKT
ncbi:MAG TPA: LPS assembly lipoprotein LptE [Ottowia sp.]|uniref:LPS-assembly lipoprotein LptE n=1 Tax=Ottowia sp. TaxID=1898956 RepID=UPI002BE6D299|nr:LPS assembly lipoprotein LptE [Ottowia sp.]HMN22575.1 LPS assembly lipoprotein LptE [Ottowia sp.]